MVEGRELTRVGFPQMAVWRRSAFKFKSLKSGLLLPLAALDQLRISGSIGPIPTKLWLQVGIEPLQDAGIYIADIRRRLRKAVAFSAVADDLGSFT